MLKLNSLFWATNDQAQLCEKLESIGFKTGESHRYPQNKVVYFGPDAFEIMQANEKTGEGIIGFEFESDDISNEYKEFKKKFPILPKPMIASENSHITWYGFYLPTEATPCFETWIIMTAPDEMKKFDGEVLPRRHLNSAFGFESVSFAAHSIQSLTKKWSETLGKPDSGLHWNELQQTQARRILAGDKFIDAVEWDKMDNKAFMLTVRVVDLELAKSICEKAGVKTTPCANRDGFMIAPEFFDGIHLRFVRHYWKRFLPLTKSHFPYYRREDKFRPLGGVYTSTLEQGFEDDWTY